MTGAAVSVSRDGEHRFGTLAVPAITPQAGGVEGDAHAGVTVQHRSRVAPGELGENITTSGLDLLAPPRGALPRPGVTGGRIHPPRGGHRP